MKAAAICIFSFCMVALCYGMSTDSYYTSANKNHAKKILLSAVESNDLSSVHFGILGLQLLGETIPKQNELCKFLLDAANDPKVTTEGLYYITTAHKSLGSCSQPLPVMNIVKVFQGILNDNSNMQDLFYAVHGLNALSQKPQDVPKLVKSMKAVLKKNDSLLNLGYLFHIASTLGNEGLFAFEIIEDAVVQADEVDSKYLQYEGGLSITSLIVRGAYKLAIIANKQVPITHVQAVKFANYFLSRKSVQTPKGVWSLLEALKTLSSNKYHLPVSVTLASSSAVSVESPKITLKISDILGRELKPLNVVADSATRVSDDVVVLSKKKFDQIDGFSYSLNLMDAKPEKGMYKLAVSASMKTPDPRIIETVGASITVKVMCAGGIDFIDFGTADADQTTLPKLERVTYPRKLQSETEVDTQQKILMRFNIKDKSTNKLITVHQAFVRFFNKEKDKSVTFVAEHDTGLQYKFDLDLGAKADDFDRTSGLYDIELIIGDAVLSNSFTWSVASVRLSFASEPEKEVAKDMYKPKPEIVHTFRVPEKRPAKFVSDVFSALVCAPLLILFILWGKLKINVSNFPLTLSALGFHAGLAAIFGLFGMFWLQLNMFQTIKYLIGIGLLTFLCGNKLLFKLANSKK